MYFKLMRIKMNKEKLIKQLENIKQKYEKAINDNGNDGKNSEIRSSNLINQIHDIVKNSIENTLRWQNINNFEILTEIPIDGYIKSKKQDIVVNFNNSSPDTYDKNKQIIIGVRSQMSSLDKNFDTLMERTFAEIVNLRMKNMFIVMGEVYLIPAREYSTEAAKEKKIEFLKETKIEKYINIFDKISNRNLTKAFTDKNFASMQEFARYNSTALIIADFGGDKIKLYTSGKELFDDELITSQEIANKFDLLSPINFSKKLIQAYLHTESILKTYN